jgi:copper transport protein
VRLLVAGIAVLALLAPADAFAHATLVQTTPANSAVLAQAPRVVTVVFDDTVRVAGENAAVSNTTNASVLDGKPTARGRTLTIPLRKLGDGAYSVRWSIVSDDGHTERGVLAFAVGAGSPSPTSVLGASVPLTWNDLLLRTLWYLGLLVGGGAAAFSLATRAQLGEQARKPVAQLLFFALLFTFLGGSGIAHAAPPGTRFDLVLKVALVVSLLGGAAAALVPAMPRLLDAAVVAALALLAAPTLSGHALDRDQPRYLSVPFDLAHVCSAAAWLGGLAAILYVVPRATSDDRLRRAVVHRFSSTALVSVAVLAVTGIVRALTELSAVSQAWTTSYGRALIVKTAIFLPLLGIGWVNRARLLDAFARLRRSVSLEVVAIAGIVVVVAILTELRPGKEAPRALAAPLLAALPPVLPPRDAVVDARELGDLAVAIAREPSHTTVTLLGQEGTGVDGRDVQIGGVTATPCGPGCYRGPASARISVGGKALTFDLPAQAPDASATLARITRAYRGSHTIVFDETLASSPANAHEIAPGTYTFLDRRIPAWFHLTLAHGRPVVDRMTAAAHFMVDRYVGFDVPVTVSPPPR